MISGYWSELYARELKNWRSISFQAMTRGGFVATEWLWMNYPEPFELHDYSFLGRISGNVSGSAQEGTLDRAVEVNACAGEVRDIVSHQGTGV